MTHESGHLMAGSNVAALIAALAGLTGAAIGGAASYLGNQAVLETQVEREERRERATARGVARVYAEQVTSAVAVLRYDVEQDQWPSRNDAGYFQLPALEDRRLVQSLLVSKSAQAITGADQAMRAIASIIEVEPGHHLSAQSRRVVVIDELALERGTRALDELDH